MNTVTHIYTHIFSIHDRTAGGTPIWRLLHFTEQGRRQAKDLALLLLLLRSIDKVPLVVVVVVGLLLVVVVLTDAHHIVRLRRGSRGWLELPDTRGRRRRPCAAARHMQSLEDGLHIGGAAVAAVIGRAVKPHVVRLHGWAVGRDEDKLVGLLLVIGARRPDRQPVPHHGIHRCCRRQKRVCVC